MEARKRNWFQCQAVCNIIDEQTGREVKRNYVALVDAVIYGEAEEIFTKKCDERFNAYVIKGIRDLGFQEVFPLEDENTECFWYKCKVSFITIDENAGKEKKVTATMFIMANTVKHAFDNLTDTLTSGTFEFDIVSVAKSPIVDIYPYEEQK